MNFSTISMIRVGNIKMHSRFWCGLQFSVNIWCRVLLFLARTGFIPCRYIDFYLIIPGATVCNFNWSPIHIEGISGDHSAGFGEYKKGRTKINILLSRSMMQQFMLCYFDVIWLVEKQSKSKYWQCNWKLIF